MGLWSRFKQAMREWRDRGAADHPWLYPSQQQLEKAPKYTPGGLDLSQYYPDEGEDRSAC